MLSRCAGHFKTGDEEVRSIDIEDIAPELLLSCSRSFAVNGVAVIAWRRASR
jgi:hypothetical protein